MMIFLKFCRIVKEKAKNMTEVMNFYFCKNNSYVKKCDKISKDLSRKLFKQREKCLGNFFNFKIKKAAKIIN